jgi:lipopolysaccharide heptosyltransferase I
MPIEFPSPPQRILIIKPSAIGDVVHALPFLNLVRKRWPKAHIAWLVTPACAGLLVGHPQLDEVIHFERRRLAHSWWNPAATVDLFRLTRTLRGRKFDLVVDLQGLFRSGWLARTTRAPVRVGFSNARELGWLGYTARVSIDNPEQHAIDRYLRIAEEIGCEAGPAEFHFATSDADRAAVSGMLADQRAYAVLLPGANWDTKRWPIRNFAALVGPLRDQFRLTTVVAGGSDVIPIAGQIRGAVNLAGKTSLREVTALLERAELVIANDSGPMHIAAALDRPLVTLFGPTNAVRTGPYGRSDSVLRIDIPCSPCYARKCSHQSCLQWLTVDHVLALAAAQLRLRSSSITPVQAAADQG